ncbi:hypothetical protein M409DRAFT_68322 [Zasmidium cellare ATCC 36951]|uniref:Carbohydrate kinase PfkB domain-containing protein n=1 Tax=Zasmidium cellare ATCC 36951 TaxID=1080233 RepID=A0A6A6C9N0_ZASCE|nr:uncharacterized protein M409DRAFT_68322 [Zasmidium cellare ATCC 36951]KAF2163735.1 hypothetical protein M409DRAFT_68322 [Zasmidium cellare ATCC 36951]
MDISPPVRKLIMVGACYVDTILSVPQFPQEDHKLRARSLDRRRGGNVANSLEVLQQLQPAEGREYELLLLCVLPAKTSPGTKFVRNSLAEKVSTQHCVYREDHTEPASSYIIKADATGSRTIVNYNELPEMRVEEFQERVTSISRQGGGRMWFHFEGREVETSVACMRWLKERYPNVLLSAEVEKPNREGLELISAEADVVFFSKSWAETKGYQAAEELLRSQAPALPKASLLFCTWGADGAAVLRLRDGHCVTGKAKLLEGFRVVDSVGAGDTFIAGALYALLNQLDLGGGLAESALAAGNHLAVQKVMQEGFGGLSLEGLG